jgi:hypothetical protein
VLDDLWALETVGDDASSLEYSLMTALLCI